MAMVYTLEVYEPECGSGHPSFSVSGGLPFGAISIGDTYSVGIHDGWYDPPAHRGERFVVRKVEHIVWDTGESQGHTVQVSVFKEAATAH